MKKALVLLFFILSVSKINAQKENHIWYFGDKAGLDFSTTPPTVLTDGLLETYEGCATISDKNGNLLFYTDGRKVWNKNHRIMPNTTMFSSGGYLRGSSSSTQSAVAVPMPGNADRYYIFTVLAEQFAHAYYSIIDMTLDGGLGDVVAASKNTRLFTRAGAVFPSTVYSAEKIAVVRHQNGKDFWVVMHDYHPTFPVGATSGNNFIVYPLTSAGLGTPTVYTVGSIHYGVRGYMRFSSSGKFLAVAVQNDYAFNTPLSVFVELLDFDTATGAVSARTTGFTKKEGGRFYGIEFSPNEKYLYASIRHRNTPIYQFDIATGAEKIVDSNNDANALQIGPDGKIYVALAAMQGVGYNGSRYIGMIDKVNTPNPTFNERAIDLKGGRSYEGFPTFPTFTRLDEIKTNPIAPFCVNTKIDFSSKVYNFIDYTFDFGDGTTKNGKVSATGEVKNSHTYTTAGDYTVTLTTINGITSKTVTKKITVYDKVINFDAAQFCNSKVDTLMIATPKGGAYTGTGVTGNTFSPSAAGAGDHSITYTYNVAGAGCNISKTVLLKVTAVPNAGTDGFFTLCAGTVPTLAQLQNAITGEDAGGVWSPAISAGVSTYTYTVKATSPCSVDDTSTVTLTYQAKPNAGTDGSLTLCAWSIPTLTQLQDAITGEDAGGSWSPSPAIGVATYTYTVRASPCVDDTSTVTITRNTPNAGNNATLKLCKGSAPTLAQLQGAINGEDTGGSWSPSPAVGVTKYTYTVRAEPPCSRTATSTVTIQSTLYAGTDAVIKLCEGTAPTLAQLQDAINGEDAGGSWSPSPAVGVTKYTYTIAPSASCSTGDSSTVTIDYQKKPNAGSNGTLILCMGTIPTLTQLQDAITGEDLGGSWSPSPAVGVTNYTYTVRNAYCAEATATLTVNYQTVANINIENIAVFCPTQTAINLTVKTPNPNYTYEWKDKNNRILGTSVTLSVQKTGTYQLFAKNRTGCFKKTTVDVVRPAPIKRLENSHLEVVQTDNEATQLLKIENITDGRYEFSIDNAAGPFVEKYAFDVSYGSRRLYVKDKENCFPTYYLDFFVIKPDKYFTPNNDGVGDDWKIEGLNLKYFSKFQLQIFDRYGRVLRTYYNKFDGWDGRDKNGKFVLPDDYWYELVITDENGKIHQKRSHFSLMYQ